MQYRGAWKLEITHLLSDAALRDSQDLTRDFSASSLPIQSLRWALDGFNRETTECVQ